MTSAEDLHHHPIGRSLLRLALDGAGAEAEAVGEVATLTNQLG